MGLAIDRERFDPADYRRFEQRLEECLVALERLLERPGFGTGPATVGAELELFLVDGRGRALPLNQAVRAETADPRVVLEIDRFNLELNLTPAPLVGRPFAAFASELDQALGIVRRAAAWHGGRIAMVGILPTLRAEDLRLAALSDAARYQALNNGLRRLRQEPFRIRIDGDDPLELAADDVGLEGANTSFQLHLRVDPDRFASYFNAAQLATGPVLAVAGNSPTFLGHRLWQETRVALFKQAVDDRDATGRSSRRVSRVAFGTGWITTGAYELLEESVRLHEPVLPVLGPERPLDQLVGAGEVPALDELRLHQSTVWRWNRAIYDPAEGGHVRIELRALPAGPTVVDMCANAAFALGLTLALAADADTWVPRVAFQQAHHNFYRAAQLGLRAELAWPLGAGGRVVTIPADQLIQRLLPAARQGLEDAGVLPEEVDELLAVIEARAATGQTGAVWQRRTLAALEPQLGREQALAAMLERYLELQGTNVPVHTWPVPGRRRSGSIGPFPISGGGRPRGAAGWPPRPGPGRRPRPPLRQHLDRVAVQLDDLGVRLDQRADPQQQIEHDPGHLERTAGPPGRAGTPVVIARPAGPQAARSAPPGKGQAVGDLDAAAGDRARPHAHVPTLLPSGPGVQGQGTQPRQMGGVGDVSQRAADDHAPAGPGRLLDRVDLEGDRLPLHGGIQLGPRVGPEHDQVLVEHVVDREDHRPAEVRDGQAAEAPLGQQPAALVLVEFLHVGLGHAGTSLRRDTT